MIRLNAFFTAKDDADLNELLKLTTELVEKSRQDEGNKAYDRFQSTTNPRVFMFCETWENQAVLDKHSAAPHFTYAVPKIGEMAVDGLKIESFED